MIDEQIKIGPKCSVCDKQWSKIVPLLSINNEFLCGKCLMLAIEKRNQSMKAWVQEMRNESNN